MINGLNKVDFQSKYIGNSTFEQLDKDGNGTIDQNDMLFNATEQEQQEIANLMGLNFVAVKDTKTEEKTETVEAADKTETTEETTKTEGNQANNNVNNNQQTGTAAGGIDEQITASQAAIAKIQAEIEQFDLEIGELQKKQAELEEKQTKLQEQYKEYETQLNEEVKNLERAIEDATDEAEQNAENYSKRIDDAIKSATDKFNNQEETEDGKSLNAFIQSELATVPGVASVDTAIMTALTGRISELARLMNDTAMELDVCGKDLQKTTADLGAKQTAKTEKTTELEGEQANLEDLQGQKAAAEAAAAAASSNRCDPIGYVDASGTRFDFVIDRNNDGIFNGSKEFLGAQNQWAEMAALDKNNDGIVNGTELKGLKLLVTGNNGKQSFTDASTMGISVDLDSYKGKDQALSKDQQLIGNFNLTVGGRTYEGYNTLDTENFLKKEYGNMFGGSFAAKNIEKADEKAKAENAFQLIDVKSIVSKAKASETKAMEDINSIRKNASYKFLEATAIDEAFRKKEKEKEEQQAA